jgi:acetate kinase
VAGLRIVTCHLGAGASLAAVLDGRSVDTTMGFTPLEGPVMATRSGTVDPGLVLWLEEHEHLPPHEIATALEQRSGSGWPTSASPSTTTKTITPTMTTTSPQPRRPHAPW